MRLPSWNWRSLKNMFKRQPGFSSLKMKKSYSCKLYLSFYVCLQHCVNPFPDYFLQQNHCFEQNHSNGKMQAYKCIEPSRSALKAAVLLSIVKYVQGFSHFHNPVKIVYQVTQLGLMQWYLQDPTLTHAMLLMFFYSLQNSRKVATSLCLQASLY